MKWVIELLIVIWCLSSAIKIVKHKSCFVYLFIIIVVVVVVVIVVVVVVVFIYFFMSPAFRRTGAHLGSANTCS